MTDRMNSDKIKEAADLLLSALGAMTNSGRIELGTAESSKLISALSLLSSIEQPLPQPKYEDMVPREQHAWRIVHEYGPRWWNEYTRKYPNSAASELRLRDQMAHYCVMGALEGKIN